MECIPHPTTQTRAKLRGSKRFDVGTIGKYQVWNDEWLIEQVINDMKLSNKGYEDISNVAYEYLDAYISFQDWSEKVAFMDELQKISKADLVAYAQEHLRDNYVVVNKRQGESKDLVKVEIQALLLWL